MVVNQNEIKTTAKLLKQSLFSTALETCTLLEGLNMNIFNCEVGS